MRAIAVEVARDNVVAQAGYRSAGLEPIDRGLMMASLADPVHQA